MMDGENFSADSNVSRAFITDDPEGKVFPCGRAGRRLVRPLPRGHPHNAPRVRMRTGFPWRDQGRERGSWPVAASRDVQTHHSRPLRLRPDEPPRRIHRQGHRLAGSRLRALAQPWGARAAKAPLATRRRTTPPRGRYYSGINALILRRSVIEYRLPRARRTDDLASCWAWVAKSARASTVPPSSTLDLQLAGGPRHFELTTAALFAHAFGGHQGHILVDEALRLAINRVCAGTVRSVGQKAIAAKPAPVSSGQRVENPKQLHNLHTSFVRSFQQPLHKLAKLLGCAAVFCRLVVHQPSCQEALRLWSQFNLI